MKAFLTYFLLTLTMVGAHGAPLRSEIPRSVEGNIAFYVIPELKQIWLELPYHLKGSIISVDDTHSLSIFAQTDTNLDRPEIAGIRQKFPGYKFREAVVIGKESAEIDLGINKRIALAEDPSGRAGFFSAEVLLNTAEARALKAKIQANQLPVMKLTIKRSIPVEKINESFELSTHRICDQLVTETGNQSVRFAKGLSVLYTTLSTELKSVRTTKLIDQAFDRIVNSCISIENNAEAKVGNVSLYFTSKNANRIDLLKDSSIEETSATLGAVVESEWSLL